MVRALFTAASLCVVLAASSAAADEEARGATLAGALQEFDVPALSAWSERADVAPGEAALARAVLAALRRDDEPAAEQLLAATDDASLSAEERRAAWLTLFSVRLRQGRFQDAVSAMDAADALGAEPDPARAGQNAQARALAAALVDAPAMRAGALEPGEIAIERDQGGLLRADVRINDLAEQAVIDTGAGFSTITESHAERAGLRIIGAAPISTASVATLPARVAIAGRLKIGELELENVVFLVLPDEALSFAGGRYTIDVIVGLPVLIELGRVEFREEDGRGVLAYGPSPHDRDAESNLLLNGVTPLILVSADGADEPLLMMLDTGASTTQLSPRAADDYPMLVAGVETTTATLAGAGGSRRQEVRVLPSLRMSAGGMDVTLRNVAVTAFARDARHGLLGMDVLSAGAGYVLDFQALRFEILSAE